MSQVAYEDSLLSPVSQVASGDDACSPVSRVANEDVGVANEVVGVANEDVGVTNEVVGVANEVVGRTRNLTRIGVATLFWRDSRQRRYHDFIVEVIRDDTCRRR